MTSNGSELTWGMWYFEYSQQHPEMFSGTDVDTHVAVALQQCWNAAQASARKEDASTKEMK